MKKSVILVAGLIFGLVFIVFQFGLGLVEKTDDNGVLISGKQEQVEEENQSPSEAVFLPMSQDISVSPEVSSPGEDIVVPKKELDPPANENPPVEDPDIESKYFLHKNITATVFWIGEPQGAGSSEDNAVSAWDDEWQKSYGGYDDPYNRNGYFPQGFTPKENPFYLDLPYNDFNDDGERKANAYDVVTWASEKQWTEDESMMKNRWVKLFKNGSVCYGQIEDTGPYEYNDYNYVFGTSIPKNKLANNAGLDVSPALRDCLQFEGLNTDENQVDWQFVEIGDVPAGPWKQIVTASQINWK